MANPQIEQLTYFILSRKMFESAIWRNEPHILKLFIYLIGTARHSNEPKKFPSFEVKRGELVTSLSQIAENNEYIYRDKLHSWSRAKVSRMLDILEKQGYIVKVQDTYGTHLKVCNYDTYQNQETYKRTQLKRNCNATETQLKTYNNDNNDKNDKKILSNKLDLIAKDAIKYFNTTTQSNLSLNTEGNLKFIRARLAENHSLEDCKKVIDKKYAQWKDDPKMSQYIRIKTLFNSENFDTYLNQRVTECSDEKEYEAKLRKVGLR